jgi:hypothetical protein
MDLESLLRALEATSFATEIRENDSIFPWIESIHVLAITLVVGSISIVDLRLLGWASRERSVSRVTASVLPCTWTAFAFAAVSGALLFSSNAITYAHNTYFLAKFALIGLAGLNMLVFHLHFNRGVENWGSAPTPPAAARVIGALSLLFWIGVIACGRWVGFTLTPMPTPAG